MRGACDMLEGKVEDDSMFALIYSIDEDDDFTDPSVWIKSFIGRVHLNIILGQGIAAGAELRRFDVGELPHQAHERMGVVIFNVDS